MRTQLLVLASLFVASAASAAGFKVDTHDARATALGVSLTADVDDPSAVLYNPAGLVQGKKLQVRLGDTLIIPMFQTTPAAGETQRAKSTPVPPPHFYISYGFDEDATIGLGFYVPYGLDLEWEPEWAGRGLITFSSLKNYFINPEIAYRLWKRLRIGAGVEIVRSTVELKRDINLVDRWATLDLAGGAWGVGANAGLQLDVLSKDQGLGELKLGAAYRTPVSLAFSGAADFESVPDEFAHHLKDQDVKTSLTLPQSLSLGLAYANTVGGVDFRIGFSAEYTGWQTLGALKLEFEDPSLSQTLPKRLQHAWAFGGGLELGFAQHYRVRVGAMYDGSPFPPETLGPDLPDADRINVSGGLGYRRGGLALDLAYMAVLLQDFESTYAYLPATYGGTVHVLGLTLGYSLDL